MVRHRTGAPMPIPGSDVTLSRDLALTIAGRGDTTTETADQMLRRNKKNSQFFQNAHQAPPVDNLQDTDPYLEDSLGTQECLFLADG